MSTPSAPSILVVEDEAALAEILEDNLRDEGFHVIHASDGRRAERAWREALPDVVVLDVMLPHMDGVTLCRRMRDAGDDTPVLFLSARGEPADRVAGLQAGGDDYLPKPFHLGEFLLRIKAMLRRKGWIGDRDTTIRFGGHEVDVRSWNARLADGTEEVLGEREVGILRLLHSRPKTNVSRDDILDEVWRDEPYPSSRTLHRHVTRLRRLFEQDASNPRFIHHVPGAGYRFTPEGEGGDAPDVASVTSQSPARDGGGFEEPT